MLEGWINCQTSPSLGSICKSKRALPGVMQQSEGVVGKGCRSYPRIKDKGESHAAELSSTVVFRDRDNPAASWNDTPLMVHRVTLLYSNGIINSAALNENHVICQCFVRYFNREATKVQSTRLQTKEMVIGQAMEALPNIKDCKLTFDITHIHEAAVYKYKVIKTES